MFNKILKIAEANAKIDALKAEVSSYEEQLEASKKHLADADDYGQSLRGDLAEQDIKIKFLENEIQQIKEEKQSISEKSLDATAQAVEIVASLGIYDPVPAETKEEKNESNLLEVFTAITDPAQKMKFYKKHRNKLLNLEQ